MSTILTCCMPYVFNIHGQVVSAFWK
ncbi:nitrate/nitrite transporter NrtS [Leptodesmis sp.]